ncbi:hypothetical protein [Methylobacterium oxalidis]|uniref:hypothetical protein n=1 Tax=Methylobacterium oxalidis TaxID=944322 RepID=UPI0011BF074B|nr:hypothetical protein [Methylobacterium oxalidis]
MFRTGQSSHLDRPHPVMPNVLEHLLSGFWSAFLPVASGASCQLACDRLSDAGSGYAVGRLSAHGNLARQRPP